MSKFKKWENIKKDIEEDFTEKDFEEMELEKQIIRATIVARKNNKVSQTELSQKTGIKQPVIARFEKGAHSPNLNTVLRILKPLGYTLKVVPIQNSKKSDKINIYKTKKQD